MRDQIATVDLDRLTEPVGFLTVEQLHRIDRASPWSSTCRAPSACAGYRGQQSLKVDAHLPQQQHL